MGHYDRNSPAHGINVSTTPILSSMPKSVFVQYLLSMSLINVFKVYKNHGDFLFYHS